jgi:hypothetical protein
MQSVNPNSQLPDIIRVRAVKGFRGPVEGRFTIVQPGDVVEIPRILAFELRAAGKAVMTDAELKRQKDYLPARKKNPVRDQGSQIAQLAATVEGLVSAVQALVAGRPSAKA